MFEWATNRTELVNERLGLFATAEFYATFFDRIRQPSKPENRDWRGCVEDYGAP
jgi:hypothetical protein